MLDHIKWERIFTTTYLTTFRIGLPGDSSTTRTLYQSFRTKKHVLDAISRKKLYFVAWGGRGRWFKSSHSDQESGIERFPIFFFILFEMKSGFVLPLLLGRTNPLFIYFSSPKCFASRSQTSCRVSKPLSSRTTAKNPLLAYSS